MTGSRIKYAMLVLAVASLGMCGCAKFKQIRPVSANLESITPMGMKSIEAVIAVEIDNPAAQVSLSKIEGVVYYSGKVFGRVAVDPFILNARSLEKYHLRAALTLDGGVSLMDLMPLLKGNVIDGLTIDLNAKASLKGGASKKFELQNVPLAELYELIKP